MATFVPADYERIRKAFGYPINALYGISQQAARFSRDMTNNAANVDYVAAVKDLLDLVEESDEAIALKQSDGSYAALSISIPGEVTIVGAGQGSTSADGLYSKRAGYIRQLEDLLRPYGMFSQGGRVESR